MMRFTILIALSFSLIALLSSCEHDAELPLPVEGVKSSVCFDSTVFKIIEDNCAMSGCHNGSGEKGSLLTYEEIRNKIKPGDPNASELYKAIVPNRFTRRTNMPPSPRAALDNSEITLIELWILQEGKSFSKVVLPIIQSNCQAEGCHSGAEPAADLLLTDFNQIKNAVENKSLEKHIQQLDDYSLMPPGGQLSDCDISQIKKWISNGLPND
jgi:hypothetical protein